MSYNLDTVTSWAKRKWFVYPGSDIYWGLANAWDWGPYGSQLKKNVQDLWWEFFVSTREDMVWMDSQILMHPRTWDASGHTSNFSDPLVDDKITWKRYRADKIIEDYIDNMKKELSDDEVLKKIQEVIDVDNLIPESWWNENMAKFIIDFDLKNPDNWKKADWTDVRNFNMMYYTYQWVLANEDSKIWLRPETAQWIFLNFKNVLDTTRNRVPFGIAQIGKSFRNEITPWQFLYRVREFEQAEIEYFVENDEQEAMKHFEQWKESSYKFWKEVLWFSDENLRFRDHEKDELSHYSKATVDVEYNYPWGWGELQGLAYRTDFDLKQHQEFSGKDLQYNDPKTWKRYIPHVIEPSFGLTRMVFACMMEFYDEEEYTDPKWNTQSRVVVRFPENIAPVKYAVLPLMEKKEDMYNKAREVFQKLSKNNLCEFDTSGNIWKRYRRQDEIWTPYCITIDHQTLEDDTVTIRNRDDMSQERVSIESLCS